MTPKHGFIMLEEWMTSMVELGNGSHERLIFQS